jgi:hypothetical protein
MMTMSTQTPWGKSDSSTKLAPGIMRYTTPGHGGFHVSKTKNVLIHQSWRKDSGWYEEDCEWVIVAFTFPKFFISSKNDVSIESIIAIAKDQYPDEYTLITGRKVSLDESHVLRYRADTLKHINDWIAVSAVGDWHHQVPAGKVGITAAKGGHSIVDKARRYFLIDSTSYDDKANWSLIGYLVQPTDLEVEAPFTA